MTISRRNIIQGTGAATLLASIGQQARARAIDSTKVIVGFAPDGTADIVSRRVADKLHPGYAKTVAVENKTGKARPALANIGSPAGGSSPHFLGSLLGRAGGVDLRHVAFRGTQPAILDVIGGQIAAVAGPSGEFTQQVAAEKCRLLATSGPKRGKFTPNTPTLLDQGCKDLVFTAWFGFFLPARAPAEVVQRLNAGIRSALASQDVIDGLAAS